MSPRPDRRVSNGLVAIVCGAVFLAMVGAAFAAVPLFRAFCQATVFNGAAKRVAAASGQISARTITVRFDTNVNGIAWRFQPEQASQTVHLGETRLAFFRATNTGPAPLTGRALYNVLPESAGPYFSKLECFCFRNQTLRPGETAEFPVVYVVDPRFGTDPDTRGRTEIVLSYTFFPAAGTARSPSGGSALGATSAARL
ncbi:MAG: cytochrome c oxidase assembly protein [Caulobacteraceae bacterium]|nr:cytochrome c oxidase assembly protein [Caulobacteraceae bacterium]